MTDTSERQQYSPVRSSSQSSSLSLSLHRSGSANNHINKGFNVTDSKKIKRWKALVGETESELKVLRTNLEKLVVEPTKNSRTPPTVEQILERSKLEHEEQVLARELQLLKISLQKEQEEEYFRVRQAAILEDQATTKSTATAQKNDNLNNNSSTTAPSSPTTPQRIIPCPMAGVKLWYLLEEFIDMAGGLEAIQNWTTIDVVQQMILPFTTSGQCSYCDMLQQTGHPAYDDTADVFISHVYNYYFVDLLRSLEWHLRDELDDVTVWIDIFSMNQHATHIGLGPRQQSLDSWLGTSFQTAVSQIGRTIMVMTSWDDPVIFTRSWCLFEAYCGSTSAVAMLDSNKNDKKKRLLFEIAMSKADERIFLQDMRANAEARLKYVRSTMQLETSQCSSESDRESIFRHVRRSVGFTKVDSTLFASYCEWAMKSLRDRFKECSTNDLEDAEEAVGLLRAIGCLNLVQGRYDRAEKNFTECIERSKAMLDGNMYAIMDEDHPDILTAMYHLGRAQTALKKYDKAQDTLFKCLEGRKTVLGKFHPDTMNTMEELALTYSQMGKSQESQHLYEICYERRKNVLGEHDDITLSTMDSLAVVYALQGKHSESQFIYEQCLERRQFVSGSTHPDTLSTMNNLAVVYSEQGKDSQARELYKRCLELQGAAYGDLPDTIRTIKNLELLEKKMGL